ncbi:hypothetical protein L1S34_14575 [Flavobacterium sp. K77]|uniref:hypothetical protein n=1 Tax=Flavobacterium sp. K77 TaxID=2910676 RepID=UPI001F2D992F|nr:hypothetical protein [Flavobacterium sp. K77]MCF6142514.1 hypothetical protein [Flavobacterium sp. K77]
MKKIINILILIMSSQLLMSCDPPHFINFINNTDSTVKVKFNLNPKVENYDLERITTNDSIVFNIKPKDTANLHFGIGSWSDKQIEELTSSINNIEIETQNIKTIYKTKKSMDEILKENRHGFWFKTKIEINIE